MICKKIEISKWDKGRMTVSVGSVVSVILNRQIIHKIFENSSQGQNKAR